jgi:AcrR family transcriptional regulator
MARRAGLDRNIVVGAAVEILNSAGSDALTINCLARKLDVQPPSLYNHIDGMPGLYRELALRNAHQLGERLGSAAIGRSGADAVESIAQAYRNYIKEQPGVYSTVLRASRNQEIEDPELREAEDRVVRIVLAVIASFGLEGEDALHAVRGLRSVVHGFASLEIAGGFGLPLNLDESFRRLIHMLIQGMQSINEPD